MVSYCRFAVIVLIMSWASAARAAAPTAPGAPTYTGILQSKIGVVVPALAGGATSYNLQRAHDTLGVPGTWSTIVTAVPPAATYLDTGRMPGNTYWYRLTGVNASGSTTGTASHVIMLPGTPAKPAPSAFTTMSLSIALPNVASIAGAASLILQRAPDVSSMPGTYATRTTWTQTTTGSFSDSGLMAGTHYWYRLLAADASGTTTGFQLRTVTLAAAPAAPAFGAITSSSVAVVLPKLETGQASWTIARATSSSGPFTNVLTGLAAGTHSDTSVSASTNYWYQLVAVNASGGSTGASNEASTPAASTYTGGLGTDADLGGYRPFPDDNAWNTPIDTAPVDPNSANLIASIGLTTHFHPDFGANWNGGPFGIPYTVVDSTTPFVPITFTLYGDQSDPGPYPVPPNAPIEPGGGDDHVLVVDMSNQKLYEMWLSTKDTGDNGWSCGSGAIFDMTSDALRPAGWTSADAAGLPVFPGLVRYDEVVIHGAINHALRFTISSTRAAEVAPARHHTGSNTDVNVPPMGMRVRLKASFDISSYPADDQVILTALKKYGMIVADNGSNWYLSGTADARWNDNDMNMLKNLVGSDFEVVQMGTISTN